MKYLRKFQHSVLAVGLAGTFFFFFQFTKHFPLLRTVNVFGNDPYDAVGSLAILFAGFAAMVSLYWEVTAKKQKALQAAILVVLAVAITLFFDAVALLRYPAVWLGNVGGQTLFLLTTGLTSLTAVIFWKLKRDAALAPHRLKLRRAMGVTGALGVVFFIYPASWTHQVVSEVFTIIFAVVTLFVLVRWWAAAFFPEIPTPFRWKLWWLVLAMVTGAIIGLSLFQLEARSEGIHLTAGIPVVLLLIFVSVPAVAAALTYFLLFQYLGFSESK